MTTVAKAEYNGKARFAAVEAQQQKFPRENLLLVLVIENEFLEVGLN